MNALSARVVHKKNYVHGSELFVTCCHCVLCAANLLQPCTPSTAGFWTSGIRKTAAAMPCMRPPAGTELFVWQNYAMSTPIDATGIDTYWATGQPDCVANTQTCIQLTTAQYLGERWDDVDCAATMSCAICELDIWWWWCTYSVNSASAAA